MLGKDRLQLPDHRRVIPIVFLKHIATLGPVGYIPFAPGTFGSLAAALLFILLKPDHVTAVILLSVSVAIGTLSSHYAEKHLREKDSRHIVIDEFAGYAVSALLLPPEQSSYIAAFLLFRFFDILKPPPIRKLEQMLPGGIGIMADDVVAGIFANISVHAWRHLILP